MAQLNKVILLGRVGKDPEVKSVGQDGKKVATLSLATSEKYNGEEKTEWHKVQVWGKTAEVVENYVRKGSELLVEGKITYREHEGKWYTTIVADKVSLGSKPQGVSDVAETRPTQMPAVNNSTPVDDDLPF
jgi:single-strand DNA-binding protein